MSNDNTPQIVGDWKKGSLSNTLQNVGCAWTAPTSDGGLAIRRDTGGPVLYFDAAETAVLAAAFKGDEFGTFPLP